VLFLAAIIPGIILAVTLALAVFAMAPFWPSFVGSDIAGGEISQETGCSAVIKLLPILALIALVLGAFTPASSRLSKSALSARS
jgi:C4-dicarboxylate transporter DctM subunit